MAETAVRRRVSVVMVNFILTVGRCVIGLGWLFKER